MSKIKNVDSFKITWSNSEFRLDFKDVFGFGSRFIFPPEDIQALCDGLNEALARYERGEASD